jgi:predicted metal-dependent hydrolase
VSGAEVANRVQYGETVIAYDVAYAPRKTLAITVAPDLRVTVTAPLGATPDAVAARVRKRAPWIVRQQRELERYLPARPLRRYVSGETHRYLGRQYRLKVVEEPRDEVKLARGRLYVWTPDRTDTARVKALLDAWYHTQASRVFRERLRALVPQFHHAGVVQPELVIKPLQACWGSCTGAGTITLNLALIQAPKPQIDYVIVHELSHLVERNHSKRFYQLLDRMLPAWRERRRQLNESYSG